MNSHTFYILFIFLTFPSSLFSSEKRDIKNSYQVLYHEKTPQVESLSKMFSEGSFYGRLRSNTFYYAWDDGTSKQNSHTISGLGGSLVYKSARFKGIDFTLGLYYSRAFFDADDNPASIIKSGKDTFSRFDYTNGKGSDMAVLGEAYLRLSPFSDTQLRVGRQIVESFYTKSNDSKMIPNTFDAVVIKSKLGKTTDIQLGYLAKQKLRDHSSSHGVLVFGDANSSSDTNAKWNENDDSAMHKGLTYTRLTAAGVSTSEALHIMDIKNKSIKNLAMDFAMYEVPHLVSEIMTQMNYIIKKDGYTITPGFRYIKQFDNGAGNIGGAAYNGTLAGISGNSGGYKDASSLDAQMIAARVVTKVGAYKFNLAFTAMFDEADLIAPWRGFPTAGYTRSMARYNWQANTKSYRAQVVKNSHKKGKYSKTYIELSFLHTDADESKGYFDENYYYAGFIQNIKGLDQMQWRLRLGYADTENPEANNLDARFEINYLF